MTRLLIPLALACCLLAGCAGSGGDSTQQAVTAQSVQRIAGREWELKDIAVQGHQMVMDLDMQITLRFEADGRVSGRAPVNRYNGTYRFSPEGALAWGTGGFAATRAAGAPELMEKERTYLNALGQANTALVGGTVLILQGADAGVVLTFAELGR